MGWVFGNGHFCSLFFVGTSETYSVRVGWEVLCVCVRVSVVGKVCALYRGAPEFESKERESLRGKKCSFHGRDATKEK